MFKRTLQALLLTVLMIGTLWAATDSFVGDWKLNPSKSKIIDVMKVESLGGQKYAFDFGGGPEKIAVDGTDQSGAYGTMLSVTAEGPDSWKVVRRKDGRMLLTANWKLSQDGKTLTDNYTEFGPTGSPSTTNYLYHRTAGGSGFAGTWESTMPADSTYILQIRPFEENGLSFIRSSNKVTQNVKFDVVRAPGRRAHSGNHRQDERQDRADRVRRTFRRPQNVDQNHPPHRPARTEHLRVRTSVRNQSRSCGSPAQFP